MNYEQAYKKMLNTIMDESDNIHVDTLNKVQVVNSEVAKEEPFNQSQKDRQRKKEILSIKDRSERQQSIRENMELFQ